MNSSIIYKTSLIQPLFAIKGCVLGMEINLDTTAIPFGSVFRNSSTSKKN
jgi:hypothetical protein